jgi:hypothetical protein
MSLRFAALAVVAAAVTACQSSAPYGSPGYAAAAAGVGVAGAAVSRAMGGCVAICAGNTHCNKTTGLCERDEAPHPVATQPAVATAAPPGSAAPAAARASAPAANRPAPRATASYPPGHEYEVPPASAPDAGCEPAASDSSALTCEPPDAGANTPH